MEVNHRYQEYGEAYLFFLHSIIDKIVPEGRKNEYKSKLIEKLKGYQFMKRGKKDPIPPNSVEARKKIKIMFKDIYSPEETAESLITVLQGYYLVNTQERIKKYIVENL